MQLVLSHGLCTSTALVPPSERCKPLSTSCACVPLAARGRCRLALRGLARSLSLPPRSRLVRTSPLGRSPNLPPSLSLLLSRQARGPPRGQLRQLRSSPPRSSFAPFRDGSAYRSLFIDPTRLGLLSIPSLSGSASALASFPSFQSIPLLETTPAALQAARHALLHRQLRV